LANQKTFKLEVPENSQKVFRSPAYVNGIFKEIDELLKEVTITSLKPDSCSERIDRVVLHPFWGVVTLVVVLVMIFQALFSWATPFMDLIEEGFALLGEGVSGWITHDLLRSLIVDGIIGGVGGVLVFLP